MTDQIQSHEGRSLFGMHPLAYDRVRPAYPDWIFAALTAEGALAPNVATLDVGAGTGNASEQALQRGAGPLVLLEPDQRMHPFLRDRFARSGVSFASTTFEDFTAPAGSFDLILSGTAFHWVRQDVGWHKLRELLAPGGTVALFWNVFQVLGAPDPFHEATRELLAPLAASPSGAPDALPYALDHRAREGQARAAGFSRMTYLQGTWTYTLDSAGVVALYGGFSGVARLPEAARGRLLAQLREIAESRFSGQVVRNVTSCLYVLRV